MPLNKSKGNMYGFITDSWNPIRGKCSHECKYCYNLGRPFFEKDVQLVEKELKTRLGKDKFIFVGSSTDMFADNIPFEWIKEVLLTCFDNMLDNSDNKFLFQTKNPKRFKEFVFSYDRMILCSTIESNRDYDSVSKAPSIAERVKEMADLKRKNYQVMLTLEPILDFDLEAFKNMIDRIKPNYINIGADSKGHKLPEPNKIKLRKFVSFLKETSYLTIKPNLRRLLK